MPIARAVQAQRDFSGGEADIWLKRSDDHPLLKSAARQMSNWRMLSSRGLNNRPGRRALALEGPRVDHVVMSPGNTFYLAFGKNYLRVYNAAFTKVFDSGNVMPWIATSVGDVVWDIYKSSIYITFTGMQPQILAWDGASQVSTWTLTAYAERVSSSGQKRTIFYRLSPLGITCQPSAPVGGSVNSLTINSRGSGFASVPVVTIGAPGAGGTTATATATLNVQSVAISGNGKFTADPIGTTINLPNGVALLVTGTFVDPNGFAFGIHISSVSILVAGSLAAGAIPANPVAGIAFSGPQPTTVPTFTLTWQLATLTLTNGGGSGYSASPPAVSLSPSGGAVVVSTVSTGAGATNTTITFSAGMTLTNAYVGSRIRFVNRQILITGVTSPTVATGVIEEPLFSSAIYKTAANANLNLYFAVGDELIGQTSGAKALVASISGDGLSVTVQYLGGTQFIMPEIVVGNAGSIKIDTATSTNLSPAAVTVWDEEVMNAFRTWPQSCFVDQGRLGFCDFPALPGLIGWSAVGDFTDLYTDDNNVAPTNAIQELVPGKSRVLYVMAGAEGSEFVFCDNAIYYIPINQNTPLKPGSVAFNVLNSSGSSQVQPRKAQQSIVYIGAGDQQMKAVQAIGAYSRPYIVDDVTELHSHLIKSPVAIAVPGGSNQFEENYLYSLNADGTLMIAKFQIANGVIDVKTVGWMPWSGGGTATWISALQGYPDVLISGSYAPNGIAAVSLVEQIDGTQYLDAAMLYNTVPAALTPPGGKGPLWWIAGGTVDLMDGVRMMGTYAVDANGFLVAQNNAGEDFTSATLAAGQAWTATLEPFVPPVQPGQDVNQRLRKRRIQRFEVYVQNSSGFTMCRLFGGPITPTSPAVGTIMQRRRIEAWNQDDDPTQAPPLREQSYSTRPTGRMHDPRVAIIKDTPGPLTILEIDLEVSV